MEMEMEGEIEIEVEVEVDKYAEYFRVDHPAGKR